MRRRRRRGLGECDRFAGPIVPFGALGQAASIASSAAAVLPEAGVPFLLAAATVLQAIEMLASDVGRRACSWRRGWLARRRRREVAFVIRHDRALAAVCHVAGLLVAPLRARHSSAHTQWHATGHAGMGAPPCTVHHTESSVVQRSLCPGRTRCTRTNRRYNGCSSLHTARAQAVRCTPPAWRRRARPWRPRRSGGFGDGTSSGRHARTFYDTRVE